MKDSLLNYYKYFIIQLVLTCDEFYVIFITLGGLESFMQNVQSFKIRLILLGGSP